MKTKLTLIYSLILLSMTSTAFAQAPEIYVRGIMIAVDSRDHSACQIQKERLELLRVDLDEDLCVQDNENPLRVVVLTIPSNEWDFIAEVDLSRNAKKSILDNNVGFTRDSNRGLLYILPSSRHSDNSMRLAVRQEHITAAQVRLSDLSMLSEAGRASMTLSFIHKNIPARYTQEQRMNAERIIRRVRIKSHAQKSVEENESSALSSLNILNGVNSTLQNATDNESVEMGFFIPDLICDRANGKCGFSLLEGSGLFPKSFGFTFKISF